MSIEQMKELWGEELFKVFGNYLDEDGWLTSQWCDIIEENLSDWDDDFNDTNEKKEIYGTMYNIEFEYNADETKIRRLPEFQ